MTDIKQDLIDSVLSKTPREATVTVTLANGQEDIFTKNILPLMIGDPFVSKIVDNASGEIIYLA